MGSDMYMASQSFRARPPRFRWEGEEFVVETDHFVDGYTEYFRGPVSTQTERVLLSKVIHCEVPPQPERSESIYREANDAPEYVYSDSRRVTWAAGWNDAVKHFGIQSEKTEQPWETWQTLDSDSLMYSREDGIA